jgi:nitroreductase
MKPIICVGIFLLAISCNSSQDSRKLTTSSASENVASQTNDIWEVFKTRRSVRKYKPDSVPEKDILKIIDAARMAPTSGNQQPWKFLIIRDRNTINKMKEACIKERIDYYDKQKDKKETREQFLENCKRVFENYCSAPVYIVVLTDNNSTYPDYNHWDGPLAAGYLLLAARSLGYGTVFITDAISEKVTKEVLNIPDKYTRVCITPLGIPTEWPEMPPKKTLNEFIIKEKL